MPQEVLIWVDGVACCALPLPDRGLDYGDGVFETILLVAGKPIFLGLHLSRLGAGLSALGIPDCLAQVKTQIGSAIKNIPCSAQASMRVTVTRGEGPRGYAAPEHAIPRIIISVYQQSAGDYTQMQHPASIALSEVRWSFQPTLAGIKHLNRLEQVLAANQKRQLEVDEVLMLSHDSQVISVSAGNIFALLDGQLLTPALLGCGVKGTRRSLVLETLAPALGLPARESELSLTQLKAATEVFYCNTLVGFRPVAQFADREWNSFDVCSALHSLYCERVH